MARDYYEVLGVSRTATPDELQQAYRKLARRHHPDVNKDPGSEERFKEINEAYHVLSDPKLRARYDRFGANFRQVPEGFEETVGAGRRGAPGGFGRDFGRGPGRRRAGWTGVDTGIDIEDLLGGLFGARGAPGPIPGADQEAELELPIEDAYHGGRRRITLDRRSFEVRIPPGVIDGQRIRLAGQGGHGRAGAPRGDLYLVVRLASHPRYRVEGRDIHVDLPLAPWEAALGASVPVETPARTPTVQVPPGSSSGRRLRLRGQGMPNPRGTPGDLYAEVRVVVPGSLDPRERALFEQLAEASSFDPRSTSRRRGGR